MRAKDDFSSLVLRLVQKINLIAHYLFVWFCFNFSKHN